jgi:hypothetical protein
MSLTRRTLLTASAAAAFTSTASCASERTRVRYITPDGQGDGSSWDSAASIDAIDDLIGAVRAGGEILIAADRGPYAITHAFEISNGGGRNAPIRIRGVNSATSEPTHAQLQGARGEDETDVFRLRRGANNLVFSHLAFTGIGNGCVRASAPLTNLTVEDCTADDIYRFFENSGPGDADATISGFTVRRCTATGVQRGFLRVRYGSRNGLIEDCRAQGITNDSGHIPAGCALDDRAQNITYRRAVMENFQQQNGEEYWNGDGFSDEEGNRSIRYEACEARGSTDGGFDCKSRDVVLENCIAEDNKRNFRIWSARATLTNCTSRVPNWRGAAFNENASPCHIWIGRDHAQLALANIAIEGDGQIPILEVEGDDIRVTLSGSHPPLTANWGNLDDTEIVSPAQQ